MKFVRTLLDKQARLFQKGGPFHKFEPIYEATDTFLYTPGTVTDRAPHVRDAFDLKRMMSVVVVALIPCTLMAMYNTGLQANAALNPAMLNQLAGWRHVIIRALGIGYEPGNVLACFIHGALYFLPAYIVTIIAGGIWETVFALVRKHEINEGFLVTSLLFPLILPPTVPLWQVAVGISFGVIIGKEVFGGTGMNIFNPALVARAFLFFAYPAEASGDKAWTAVPLDRAFSIDGFSGATLLANAKADGLDALHAHSGQWLDSFLGFIPGSMGETSALACLLGAIILIITGVGSWRIIVSVCIGTIVMTLTFNLIGSKTNPMFAVPFWWHMALGGWAFGTAFMATDPVSSAFTETGKWIYGFGLGVLVVLVRVVNPAFPEGMMLSILFMNMFAPLIDYFVVQANVKRRLARYAA